MTNLKKIDKLMKYTVSIRIDREGLLNSWDYLRIKDKQDDDNIISAYWNDEDGSKHETHITKKGIEEGKFTSDAFVCEDENGDKTRIEFFASKKKNLIGE